MEDGLGAVVGEDRAERREVGLDERAPLPQALAVEARPGKVRAARHHDLFAPLEQPLDEGAADDALRAGYEGAQMPPATAGRIVTSSPSSTCVSNPSRKRMSSPPT